MRKIEFDEIMRDAEVAHAIHPVVLKYFLTWEETTAALLSCGIARAKNVAYIATSRFFSVPTYLSET
jgi:hypothetical protein